MSARRLALALALVLLVAEAADARAWSWLGVRIREMSEPEMDEIAARHGFGEGFGVVIVDVIEGTPAARAGMRQGDVVVAFEGRPVTDTRLLQRLIARAPVDDDVRLTVLRREGRRPLAVRLVPMPRPIAGERIAAEFGFVLREGEARGEAGEPTTEGPAAVTFVARGGAAERAGLQPGDVIVQVNARPVSTREAAREALADLGLDTPLRLQVRREDRRLELILTVGPGERRP